MRLYKARVREVPERMQLYGYRTEMLRPESTRQDKHRAFNGAERIRKYDISSNAESPDEDNESLRLGGIKNVS